MITLLNTPSVDQSMSKSQAQWYWEAAKVGVLGMDGGMRTFG